MSGGGPGIRGMMRGTMFEVAELGRKVSRQEFDEAVPALRSGLLEAQFALKSRKFPVIIIVSGADCAGKGEFVHRLNEWLDPRGVDTHAFWQSSDEEQARPRFWRFWRALPARGRIGIFFGSWYSEPMVRRVYREIKGSQLDGELDRIAFFEKMLADDGALIIKLWFHLSRKEQARRLKHLQRDPHTRHRVRPADRKNLKLYDRFIKTSERVIRRTDSAQCPWHLIEATDRRYRELAAGRILLESLQARLKDGRRGQGPGRRRGAAGAAGARQIRRDHPGPCGPFAKAHRPAVSGGIGEIPGPADAADLGGQRQRRFPPWPSLRAGTPQARAAPSAG